MSQRTARAPILPRLAAALQLLSPALGTVAADGPALERGVVIERVTPAGAPGQSYALYLPSAYTPERAWPILYAFDPAAQGARPVRLAAEAAERLGWIVAGSNNSRNGPLADVQAAVKALVEDTSARLSIDGQRVYATGFSGGARVAAGLASNCQGCIAGVFAHGAGLPAIARPGALGFPWFAAAGERDFNYGELFLLEQELEKRGERQRLRVFEGGHEWAPAPVWTEALEWFELLAMKDGRRPRDPGLVASLLEKATARAAAFQAAGELLDEQRETGALARDFDGLGDVTAARRRAGELQASAAWRLAVERERKLIEEQARIASRLGQDVSRLGDADSGERSEIVLRSTRDAGALWRDLADAKDEDRRLVYERALSQLFILSMESAREAQRRAGTDAALDLYQIASALRPESTWPHVASAQALARAGRKKDATRSLRRAVEAGFPPEELAKLLVCDGVFAALRDDPEIVALVRAARRP